MGEEVAASSPYLQRPLLHIQGVPHAVTDEDIAEALYDCRPLRIRIARDGSRDAETKGTIEFQKLLSAEKAHALVQQHRLDQHCCTFRLSHNGDAALDALPQARPRIVKRLPEALTASELFDLFRPHGPLHSVQLYLSAPTQTFTGTALVHFYDEQHAAAAQKALHFEDVDGMTIVVEEYDQRKSRIGGTAGLAGQGRSWAQAETFVPSRPGTDGSPQGPVSIDSTNLARLQIGDGGGGSRWATNDTSEPSDPSRTSQNVDYCNLHILRLSPEVQSADLFQAFKGFGRIVSARVMKSPSGESRGFGFVSFTTPESAAHARAQMNGRPLDSPGNPISIEFHKPKKPRAVKSAGAGNATSGTPSLGGSRRSSIDIGGSPALTEGMSAVQTDFWLDEDPITETPPRLLPTSERDRLLTAILKLQNPGNRLEEVVDLLLQLPNRDRKLCLFNAQHLGTKVAEAREVLDATDEEFAPATPPPGPEEMHPSQARQAEIKSTDTPVVNPANSSGAPATANKPAPKYTTIVDLAKLPAAEVIQLAFTDSPLIQPQLLPIVSALQRTSTDEFIDQLANLNLDIQKQKVGEKVFQTLKGLGFKKATAPAVVLVDSEDLRPLAHLMQSYPEVLRAKALLLGAKVE